MPSAELNAEVAEFVSLAQARVKLTEQFRPVAAAGDFSGVTASASPVLTTSIREFTGAAPNSPVAQPPPPLNASTSPAPAAAPSPTRATAVMEAIPLQISAFVNGVTVLGPSPTAPTPAVGAAGGAAVSTGAGAGASTGYAVGTISNGQTVLRPRHLAVWDQIDAIARFKIDTANADLLHHFRSHFWSPEPALSAAAASASTGKADESTPNSSTALPALKVPPGMPALPTLLFPSSASSAAAPASASAASASPAVPPSPSAYTPAAAKLNAVTDLPAPVFTAVVQLLRTCTTTLFPSDHDLLMLLCALPIAPLSSTQATPIPPPAKDKEQSGAKTGEAVDGAASAESRTAGNMFDPVMCWEYFTSLCAVLHSDAVSPDLRLKCAMRLGLLAGYAQVSLSFVVNPSPLLVLCADDLCWFGG